MTAAIVTAAYIVVYTAGYMTRYAIDRHQHRQRERNRGNHYDATFVRSQIYNAEAALQRNLTPQSRRSIEGAHQYWTRELERISGRRSR